MKLGYRNDGVELDGNTVIIFHTSTRFSLAHFLSAHSLSVETLKTRELKLCVYSTHRHRHSGCQADCCIVAWRMCDGDEEKVLNWLCVFLTWVRLRCCNKRDLSRKYTKKLSTVPLFWSCPVFLAHKFTGRVLYLRSLGWMTAGKYTTWVYRDYNLFRSLLFPVYHYIATNNIEIFRYLENFFLR